MVDKLPPQFDASGFRFIKLGRSGEALKRPVEYYWECLTVQEAQKKYDEELKAHAASGNTKMPKKLKAGRPTRITNYSNDEISKHKGNYGIINGTGPNGWGLVTLDADNLERIEERVDLSRLPATMEVFRGNNNRKHLHFLSNLEGKYPFIQDPETGKDIGDIRGTGGFQVVGPGCKHPSGEKYEILEDRELAQIDGKILLETLEPILQKTNKETNITKLEQLVSKNKVIDNPFKDVHITDLVNIHKFKESGDQLFGEHPIHGSDTEHNLVINPAKNTWWCGRHKTGGGVELWIAIQEGIIDCSEATKGALRGEKYLQVIDAAKRRGIIRDQTVCCEPAEDEVYERPRLEMNLPEGNFISKYVKYGKAMCDAYPEYHYASAITILSAVVDRKLVMRMKQGRFYTNTWCMCLGPSTISRKSTAVGECESVLRSIKPTEAIPKSFSPEALIEYLSEHPRSYLIKDEVSQLLASMQKNYMEEVRAFFNDIYGTQYFSRKLRTGKRKEKTSFEIVEPYVVQLCATTNSDFREYTNKIDITSGWLLRFLYFAPNYKKASMPFDVSTEEESGKFGEVMGRASSLHRLFEKNDPHDVRFDQDAIEFYKEWQLEIENDLVERGDDTMLAIWGRLIVYTLKLAVLFTVGDEDYRYGMPVRMNYMVEACRVIEQYFLPTAAEVAREVGREETVNLQNRILGELERKGGRMQRKVLLQQLHVRLKDVDEAMEALVASGEVTVFEKRTEGAGRPQIWVCRIGGKGSESIDNRKNRFSRIHYSPNSGVVLDVLTKSKNALNSSKPEIKSEHSDSLVAEIYTGPPDVVQFLSEMARKEEAVDEMETAEMFGISVAEFRKCAEGWTMMWGGKWRPPSRT